MDFSCRQSTGEDKNEDRKLKYVISNGLVGQRPQISDAIEQARTEKGHIHADFSDSGGLTAAGWALVSRLATIMIKLSSTVGAWIRIRVGNA